MKRIAVSVVLHPEGDTRQVLLVERNPKLKFFGGYHAFPGGVLDAADAGVPIENLPVHEAAGEDFPRFVAAAVREVLEETGVWMGRGARPIEPDRLVRYRNRLLADEISLAEILAETRHHIDGRDFEPLCRITTPPFVPVRYDTWFLRSRLPKGAEVNIIPGELVGGELVEPAPALDRWRKGEILIAAPNIIMLEEMSRGDGFESRILELTESYERGKLHRVYFTPGILLAPLATPTQPPATHTNTYIVGHERLYVVDPAPYDRVEQEKLWELLDEMRDEGRSLAGILLTHAHPDHVGAVVECKNRYGLPVYAHRDVGRHLPQVEFVDELEHGDSVELGPSPDGQAGWSLHAFHTPGHAPGHLAFRESRYKALIAGDLISTLSSILIDPSDGHLRTYLESLKSMEPVADGTVYPSHGPAARDGRKAIRQQIRHRQQREEQILGALTSQPRPVEDLLVKVYSDVDISMHGLARRSLLSGLIKLQEDGKVHQDDDRYRLT